MSSTESFWTFETDKAAHRHITSYAEVWACSLKACRVGEKLYTLLWQAPAPAYLRTLLQQVSQSLCVRVSGGFYKSSNKDIWLLWSNSNKSTVGKGSWACIPSVKREFFPADPRIDPSHTFALLPEWWLHQDYIRLRFLLTHCWQCKLHAWSCLIIPHKKLKVKCNLSLLWSMSKKLL